MTPTIGDLASSWKAHAHLTAAILALIERSSSFVEVPHALIEAVHRLAPAPT
jgi:hypothetical protein